MVIMADIEYVAGIINSIADGFEGACLECMDKNKSVIENLIHEQLYAGIDGEGQYINPTYDNDPYFNEDGIWKGRAHAYKEWKERITPPETSYLLRLPPRPVNIPNLKIKGNFYDSIKVTAVSNEFKIISSGFDEGSAIVSKYGDKILGVSDTAVEYFSNSYLIPWLENFFKSCGYEL